MKHGDEEVESDKTSAAVPTLGPTTWPPEQLRHEADPQPYDPFMVAEHGADTREPTLSSISQKMDAMLSMLSMLIPAAPRNRRCEQALKPTQPQSTGLEDGYEVGTLKKWIEESGFGFATVGSQTIFVHAASVRGPPLRVGDKVVMQLIDDPSHGEHRVKSVESWRETSYYAHRAKTQAANAAEAAVKAARAAQDRFEDAGIAMIREEVADLDPPPGLAAEQSRAEQTRAVCSSI